MPDSNPFAFLEQLSPQEVADRLAGEMAFVQGAALCMMSPVSSAKIMAAMDEARRREVAAAMSKSRQMPRDVLADIAEELRKKQPGGSAPFSSGSASAGASPFQGLNKLKSLQLKPLGETPSMRGVQPVEATIRPPESRYSGLPGGKRPQPAEAAPPQERRKQAIDGILDRVRGARQPAATAGRIPAGRGPATAGLSGGRGKPGAFAAAGKAQKIDGMALAAHILREAGSAVLNNVRHELPELYDRLHTRMFDFVDLEKTAPQALGQIFTGIDATVAALALRFASDSLKEKVFASISPRRAELLHEEMAADKNRVRLSAIDEAQQAVIDYALRLQDAGQLLIDPNDPDLL